MDSFAYLDDALCQWCEAEFFLGNQSKRSRRVFTKPMKDVRERLFFLNGGGCHHQYDAWSKSGNSSGIGVSTLTLIAQQRRDIIYSPSISTPLRSFPSLSGQYLLFPVFKREKVRTFDRIFLSKIFRLSDGRRVEKNHEQKDII